MRVCIHTPTGRLIESQSGGSSEADLEVLIENALSAGYDPGEIEASYIEDSDLAALIEFSKTPDEIAAQQAAADAQTAKSQAIIDHLPSWNAVETAVNNIASLAEAKAFLLKLSRVVYLDVKNSAD